MTKFNIERSYGKMDKLVFLMLNSIRYNTNTNSKCTLYKYFKIENQSCVSIIQGLSIIKINGYNGKFNLYCFSSPKLNSLGFHSI